MKVSASVLVVLAISHCPSFNAFYTLPSGPNHAVRSRMFQPKMALDEFFMTRLDSIKRTFEALTERLADPDVANDRKQMLVLSRERAAVEKTVDAYDEWKVGISLVALSLEKLLLLHQKSEWDKIRAQ